MRRCFETIKFAELTFRTNREALLRGGQCLELGLVVLGTADDRLAGVVGTDGDAPVEGLQQRTTRAVADADTRAFLEAAWFAL